MKSSLFMHGNNLLLGHLTALRNIDRFDMANRKSSSIDKYFCALIYDMFSLSWRFQRTKNTFIFLDDIFKGKHIYYLYLFQMLTRKSFSAYGNTVSLSPIIAFTSSSFSSISIHPYWWNDEDSSIVNNGKIKRIMCSFAAGKHRRNCVCAWDINATKKWVQEKIFCYLDSIRNSINFAALLCLKYEWKEKENGFL